MALQLNAKLPLFVGAVVAQHLERGAATMGDPQITRHVVIGASTGAGLGRLAESDGASVVVFGSDYRTAPGHIEPGASAQDLVNGGSVAIAIAAAGLRTQLNDAIRSIAVPLAGPDERCRPRDRGRTGRRTSGPRFVSHAPSRWT
jgi:hypothetical protein